MANQYVSIPAGSSWTKIVDNVSTDISIALIDGTIEIMATSADSEPTTDGGLPLLSHGDGWSEATILEKIPGVASAAYLWARSLTDEDARVFVSHA